MFTMLLFERFRMFTVEQFAKLDFVKASLGTRLLVYENILVVDGQWGGKFLRPFLQSKKIVFEEKTSMHVQFEGQEADMKKSLALHEVSSVKQKHFV